MDHQRVAIALILQLLWMVVKYVLLHKAVFLFDGAIPSLTGRNNNTRWAS